MSNNSLRSWSELPTEVLHYIIQQVDDKKSTFQCQLVCKSWKRPAYCSIDIPRYVT
ncbi:hypothetical protein EDC94DRAFT_522289 [Helicostylum pulchrum]|nr:hypothetical protein EDC94DRAFT_522289 [Helicostylum pulchrum]